MTKEKHKNKQSKNWYSIKASDAKKHADIYLYGYVGSWRVNIQSFLDEILQYKDYKTLDVYISSFGGTFSDGLPIFNTLRQHKAHVTTINMGYAVSMGSHLMLAGDSIKMAQNALQMIHSPLTVIWDYANARDLRKEAGVLDKHESTLIPRYKQRLNLNDKQVKKLLADETWYTADEALAAGLIDEIIDAVDLNEIEDNMVEDSWQATVSQFHKPPPQNFIDRFCNRLPDAKAYFDQIKQQALKAEQDKKDNETMTDEQLSELKQTFSDSITAAIENLSTTLSQAQKEQTTLTNTAFEKMGESLKAQAKATSESLEALAETAKTQAEKQETAIANISQNLAGIQKLPVNQQHIPEHGNASDDDDGGEIFS